MMHCIKQNRLVDGEQCLSCFLAAKRAKTQTYRLRTDCVSDHLVPVQDGDEEVTPRTPVDALMDAAFAARQYVFHRGGHSAEAVRVVKGLDAAMAAMKEQVA